METSTGLGEDKSDRSSECLGRDEWGRLPAESGRFRGAPGGASVEDRTPGMGRSPEFSRRRAGRIERSARWAAALSRGAARSAVGAGRERGERLGGGSALDGVMHHLCRFVV